MKQTNLTKQQNFLLFCSKEEKNSNKTYVNIQVWRKSLLKIKMHTKRNVDV